MSYRQKLIADVAVAALLAVLSSPGFAATTSVCSATVTPRIAAGYAHSLAVKSDGSLAAWGKNTSGQLGDGTSANSLLPKQIGTGYTAIAGGKSPDTGFTIAVKSDGSLWAWGDNTYGQLGDGTTTATLNPKQIGSDTGYVSVTAGYFHSVALKSDGSLWAWGRNDHGQLGDGTTVDRPVPTRIGTDTGYTAIAAGESHTLALKSDGSLWAWGRNDSGQLGDGTVSDSATPQLVNAGYSVIAAGKYFSLAIQWDGSLWAWGDNGIGQLGDGTINSRASPGQVGSDTGYTAIAAGFAHTVALKGSGDLWAWGSNLYGSLGDGSIVDSRIPKLIGSGYTTIAAGNYHTLALKSDGSLSAWGDNGFGQVGDGSTTSPVTAPKQIIATGFAAPDVTAPTAPSGFTAKQAGAAANLAWSAATDNVGVKGYYLYRDGVLVASPATPGYKDTGLAPSTAYAYTLAAVDGSCNLSASVSTTLTTSSDVQVPMVPANLKASPSTVSSGIDLSWTPSIDDVGVVSYQVYRGTVALPSQSQGNLTSYTDNDAGLVASTEYNYSVAACDAAGYCSAQSVPVSVITPQKLATNTNVIINLTAQPKTTGSIDLAWSVASPAASYDIYRNGALVANTSATSYSDSGLIASSSYSYSVAACDIAGVCSAQSAPVTAITLQIGAADPSQALSDCLFNWAELHYPSYFAPSGPASHSDGPYYWRAYAGTNAYLAVSSGKLYYLGPESANTVVDLGATSTWYATASCQ